MTANYLESFNEWKHDSFFDEDTRKELSLLDEEKDKKEIEDRFYCDLEFGTGGLRGVMGAGTNRMNKYTVGKATYGLGLYLLDTFGKEKCKTKGVCIGFDTRNNSKFFASVCADILSGLGIKVYLHQSARPTPMLSFSVKYVGALSGIVLTASHNPKEYNGYKVYDEYGCQLTTEPAKKLLSVINGISDIKTVPFGRDESLVEIVDHTDVFVDEVMKQSRLENGAAKEKLHIVYTPLHGTGRVPVLAALQKDGFTNIQTVESQLAEDGNFPTVASPNPEDRRALTLGIELAQKSGADIVFGTDPDCDRVGIAVKTDEGYTLMTGNQVGALLVDYVLSNTDLSSVEKAAVIKTVVTSELGAEIARSYGANIFTTLTGFKFIGEKITQFESARKEKNELCDYSYLFGYEESYGYLCGTHARDKDAVVSSMLICEMAALCKSQGKTLVDKMNELYEKFGFYKDALDSFTLKGKDGLEKIKSMMIQLRNDGSPFEEEALVQDFSIGVAAEEGFGTLPKSDVLKYIFSDTSWVAVRPSGTEPKIKIYYSIKEQDREKAEKRLERVRLEIKSALGLE
ncbi:MAG: phospho-sugar mutase [Clostridia bacterium]|nr:phospho-sugar mutase [Clostridia bacterium]